MVFWLGRISVCPCWLSVNIKIQGIILISLPLYIICSFSLGIFLFFHCSVHLMFWLLCVMGNFFSGLFGVLYPSWTLADTFWLGKLASMSLLKIFSVPLTWDFFPSSIWTGVPISSILTSVPEIPYSISCILLLRLTSEAFLLHRKCFLSSFPSVWLFLSDSFSSFKSWTVFFFPFHYLLCSHRFH